MVRTMHGRIRTLEEVKTRMEETAKIIKIGVDQNTHSDTVKQGKKLDGIQGAWELLRS